MRNAKFVAAALLAAGSLVVACDRDRSDPADQATVEEQLEAQDVEPTDDDVVVPAVPHGSNKTILTRDPDNDDEEVPVVPPPAPSGDPRMTLPEDDQIPAQQEEERDESNRQYGDQPLPP